MKYLDIARDFFNRAVNSYNVKYVIEVIKQNKEYILIAICIFVLFLIMFKLIKSTVKKKERKGPASFKPSQKKSPIQPTYIVEDLPADGQNKVKNNALPIKSLRQNRSNSDNIISDNLLHASQIYGFELPRSKIEEMLSAKEMTELEKVKGVFRDEANLTRLFSVMGNIICYDSAGNRLCESQDLLELAKTYAPSLYYGFDVLEKEENYIPSRSKTYRLPDKEKRENDVTCQAVAQSIQELSLKINDKKRNKKDIDCFIHGFGTKIYDIVYNWCVENR